MRSEELEKVKTVGYADIGEISLYYEFAGKGPPFVLLHGGLGDNRMWEDQFEFFSQDFKVIRYDARGFGRSQVPDKPYFPYRDLRTLLKSLQIEKAHVMGLSMGGAVALDFTLEFPEMVKNLILAAPAVHGFPYSEEFTLKGAELFAISLDKGAEAAARVLFQDPLWSHTIPPEGLLEVRERFNQMATDFFRVFRWDLHHIQTLHPPAITRIAEIISPVLLIAAGNDHPENLAAIDRLEAELKNSKKVVMKDTGHMLNMEKPQEFNRIVMDFLSG